MKKLLVVLLVCMLAVTGCGKEESNNNTESDNTNKVSNTANQTKDEQQGASGDIAKELVCKMSLGEGMDQDVNIKFDEKDRAVSVDTTITVDLTDMLGGDTLTDDMRKTLLATYEEMFSEKNGYKNAKVNIVGNVVDVKVDLFDATELKSLVGYNIAKSTFEKTGYTCE